MTGWRTIVIGILAAAWNHCCAADYPALVETFARPVHIGMQLSFDRSSKIGRLGRAQYDCLRTIGMERLYPVVRDILTGSLDEGELAEAESFFSSPSGRVYAKHGILKVYEGVGLPPPEPLPELSRSDQTAIAAFALTAAGRKIIGDAVLEGPIPSRAIAAEIRILAEPCRNPR